MTATQDKPVPALKTTDNGGYLRPGPIETFVSNGLKAQDYYFDLPLRHTDTSCKETITVFARRVRVSNLMRLCKDPTG